MFQTEIQSHAAKQHNAILSSNYTTVHLCRRLPFWNLKPMLLAIQPMRTLILQVQLQPQPFTGSHRTPEAMINHGLIFKLKQCSRLKRIHTFAVDTLSSAE